MNKYPDLKVDLMLEERVLDLPMREADVAIRHQGAERRPIWSAKRLMTVQYVSLRLSPRLPGHGLRHPDAASSRSVAITG